MKTNTLALSTGFALFSMFFGSGNLVFPITVGQESGGHYILASLGIMLTGVIVPFLGVFGMVLYHGDIYQYFSALGKRGTFIFSFLALALMGPFGVLARCLTVAHGAMTLIIPKIPLWTSSLSLCVIIFVLTINKRKVVSMLGMVLTPFLMFSIAMIAFFGLKGASFPATSSTEGWAIFKNGFFQGYQTMDLLAAFFFSQFIIRHLCQKLNAEPTNKIALTTFMKAMFIGAAILSAVYFSLVLLGWIYSDLLYMKPPQEMLGLIALESLGSMAAPILCLAIVFACLTTAIVLTSLFAEFIRKEVSQGKLPNIPALLITLTIGFAVSTLDFAGIARFLGPLLELIYPALIAFTCINIFRKITRKESLTNTTL